tara:strand:- start:460 stop:996 length:537 start_codon:yes stop_codon:yes gene_type:complete
MVNEIDIKVSEYLKENNITVKPVFIGSFNHDEWPHDRFSVLINGTGKPINSFEYSTGIGHRIKPAGSFGLNAKQKREIKQLKDCLNLDKVLFSGGGVRGHNPAYYIKLPSQASVLYSLIMDSDVKEHSFYDWCDCFGYDNDSLKALDIYRVCEKNADNLYKSVSRDHIKTLSELLQDY